VLASGLNGKHILQGVEMNSNELNPQCHKFEADVANMRRCVAFLLHECHTFASPIKNRVSDILTNSKHNALLVKPGFISLQCIL
jgi:hypothetical protein